MFAVIYRFAIHVDQREEFIDAWSKLTELIFKYEGSLGSRLHQESDDVYIAYAQWPDRESFENEKSNMPDSADVIRKTMKGACKQIETLHKMEMTQDQLIHQD